MSNYHVMEMSRENEDGVRVAFHIPIASSLNVGGVDYRDALVEYLTMQQGAAPDSVVPNLATSDPTHDAGIADGSIYEHVEVMEFDATLSNAEKQTLVGDRYTALTTIVPNRIQAILRFWGVTG